MSSALLYVAIVAVWGVVLVPMWLRRDGSRILGRRAENEHADPLVDEEASFEDDDVTADDDVLPEAPSYAAPTEASYDEAPYTTGSRHARPRPESGRRSRRRAAVIARRRRRTTGLTLLVLTAVGAVVSGVTPWWFILPPVAALAGHLTLLRVAVRIDAERSRAHRVHLARRRAFEAERRAREEQEARMARLAEAAADAEVIEMPERPEEEVYDQYTDQRAVGD